MRATLRNMSRTAFARRVEELAALHGLELTAESDGVRPVVCVCDSYLDPVVAAWNAQALRQGLVWVPVWANWTHPWVGPVFAPGQGCHACLAKRLKALAESFYGRLASYDAALAAADRAGLTSAIARNLLGGGAGQAAALADHAVRLAEALARLSPQRLAADLDSLPVFAPATPPSC